MVYRGEAIGSARAPIHTAARYLLDNGLAAPDDIVATYRGGILCTSGLAGELAKLTVAEHDHCNPTFKLRPYKPFPSKPVRPEMAEEGAAATDIADPLKCETRHVAGGGEKEATR
jgi:hypothetical protein